MNATADPSQHVSPTTDTWHTSPHCRLLQVKVTGHWVKVTGSEPWNREITRDYPQRFDLPLCIRSLRREISLEFRIHGRITKMFTNFGKHRRQDEMMEITLNIVFLWSRKVKFPYQILNVVYIICLWRRLYVQQRGKLENHMTSAKMWFSNYRKMSSTSVFLYSTAVLVPQGANPANPCSVDLSDMLEGCELPPPCADI